MENHYYILQDREGEYVRDIKLTGLDTVKYDYKFTKVEEQAHVFSWDDLYSRQAVLPIGTDFARGYQGKVIRVGRVCGAL